MDWINVKNKLPSEGYYLVSFVIEILGKESSPFEDKRLYAEGFFDPSKGWDISNRYIKDSRYESLFTSEDMRITHWSELLSPTEKNKPDQET